MDQSLPFGHPPIHVHFFLNSLDSFPPIDNVGEIVRLHRVKARSEYLAYISMSHTAYAIAVALHEWERRWPLCARIVSCVFIDPILSERTTGC